MNSTTKYMCARPDLGRLIMRLVVGSIFLAHGYSKFTNIEGTVGFFHMLHLPAFMAYLVAAVEVLGGIAMIIGIGTWIAGLLLAVIAVTAIALVKAKTAVPSLMGPGGYEFELALIGLALGVAYTGAGKYRLWKKKCVCGCKDGVCNNTPCDCKDCECGCGPSIK